MDNSLRQAQDNALAQIKAAQEQWQAESQKDFSRERQPAFSCESGIPLKRLYTPLDLAETGFDYLKDLGFPGQPPYTRGITPTMYRSYLWGMAKYTGYPTPKESNEYWRSQVAAGLTTIIIAYDLPTQLGYDPDHPMAEGEVGRVGVSMCSLRDWEAAMEGIDLGQVIISQVLNAPGAVGIASHLALAEKRGVSWQRLRGTCQNDILKEYTSRGNYIFPPRHALRLVSDALVFCNQQAPNYKPIEVCGIHQSEAGANPVHEAASCLANAFAYLQSGVERGLDIDAIAPGIVLLPSIEHHGFFQEIAKLRAMRRIYARTLKERFGARNPRSLVCRLVPGQGGTSLHKEQYLNNIARSAICALAGALSGVQAIALAAYDEQFGIPTVEANITSLRCQQVVAYETGVADVVDPLGGSYYVESLTSEFEERITQELQNIERLGGVLKCIESGYFRRQYAEDAYGWQKAFDKGEVKRVGVNCFANQEETRPARVYRANPAIEQERIKAVQQLRQSRDNGQVERALAQVKKAAAAPPTPENNLMPYILQAVKAYATTAEVCDVLREVWGSYTEPRVF